MSQFGRFLQDKNAKRGGAGNRQPSLSGNRSGELRWQARFGSLLLVLLRGFLGRFVTRTAFMQSLDRTEQLVHAAVHFVKSSLHPLQQIGAVRRPYCWKTMPVCPIPGGLRSW